MEEMRVRRFQDGEYGAWVSESFGRRGGMIRAISKCEAGQRVAQLAEQEQASD